jgi:hypothetical protein
MAHCFLFGALLEAVEIIQLEKNKPLDNLHKKFAQQSVPIGCVPQIFQWLQNSQLIWMAPLLARTLQGVIIEVKGKRRKKVVHFVERASDSFFSSSLNDGILKKASAFYLSLQ